MLFSASFFIIILALAKDSHGAIPLNKAITEKVHRLNSLIAKDQPPKGTAFPPLKDEPKPSDRIVIVGAGLSGLHMSYLLKKKGYKNVVVLEKESRVGGKLLSIWHDGVPHELGAAYLANNYMESVYALAEELGVDDFVPRPAKISTWLDDNSKPIPFDKFVIGTIMKLTNTTKPLTAIGKLFDAAYRYTMLHREMFGKYEGELMLKPSSKVLSKLNTTYMDFLTKHRLLALQPLLLVSHTIQGYGQLDEISALYGLMWNTPSFLQGILTLGLGKADVKYSAMFRNGFQQLTDKLAPLADIRLSTDIKGIERDCDSITIYYNDTKQETFDFLIWAADTREAVRLLKDPTPIEKAMSNVHNTWFHVSLFETNERCNAETPPLQYWIDNILQKRENSLWARRNSKLIVKQRCEGGKRSSFIGYQMAKKFHSLCKSRKSLKKTLLRSGVRKIKVVADKTWNYFPRFSTKNLAAGILWDIAKEQGDQKTWFIGSSVIFDSTKSVLEYNFLMLRRMQKI